MNLIVVFKIISSYSVLIMLGVSLRCAYSLIRNKNFNKNYWLFSLVVTMSTIETIMNFLFSVVLKSTGIYVNIIFYTQKLYLIIEVVTIVYFYIKLFKDINEKKEILEKELTAFLFATLIAIFIGIKYDKLILLITILESIIINYFFIKLLFRGILEEKKIRFKYQEIINRGLFTFINLISPYSIINEIISETNQPIYITLNFINDLGYIYFFNSLYKSAKCYR